MTALPLLARLLGAIGWTVAVLSHRWTSIDEGTVCSDRLEREMNDRMAQTQPIWLASVCDNRSDWRSEA